MAVDSMEKTRALAAKVAAILAQSSLEPGIHEMNELMRATAEARQIERIYAEMLPPAITTQTSHSNL
jgi:hypothetical protein